MPYKKLLAKVQKSVNRTYSDYGLQRRKKIARAIVFGKLKR